MTPETFPDPSSVDSTGISTLLPPKEPIGLQSPRTLRALATAYSKRPWAVGLGGVGVDSSSYFGAVLSAASTAALGPQWAPMQPRSAHPTKPEPGSGPEPSRKAPSNVDTVATPAKLALPASPVRRRRSASNFSGSASASTQASQPSLSQLLSLSYQRVDRLGAPQLGSLASVLTPTLNPSSSTIVGETVNDILSSSRPRPATMYASLSNTAAPNFAQPTISASSEGAYTAHRQVRPNRSAPYHHAPVALATNNDVYPIQHTVSAMALPEYSTEMPPPPVPPYTTGPANRYIDSKVCPPSAISSPATSGYPTPLLSRQSSHEPPLMSSTGSSPERLTASSRRQQATRSWQSQSHPVTRSSSPTRRYRRAPNSHGMSATAVGGDGIGNLNARTRTMNSPRLPHAPGCSFAHASPNSNQPIVLQPSTNATAAHLADLMTAGCTLSPYTPAIERFTHCAMPAAGAQDIAGSVGQGAAANGRRDGGQRSHPVPLATNSSEHDHGPGVLPRHHSNHHRLLEPVSDQLTTASVGYFANAENSVFSGSMTADGRSHSFAGLPDSTTTPTAHDPARSITEPPTSLPMPTRCWCTAVRYSNATPFAPLDPSDSTHSTATSIPATRQFPLETVSMPATPLPELNRSQSWTSRRTRKQGVRAKIKRSVYRLQGVSFTF
ncbi:hypothetical protein H4R35_002973 [Dimargaris xerosporica]|nr:hypothetical protein H4R35_002973 [Dimargaris xerosporica]